MPAFRQSRRRFLALTSMAAALPRTAFAYNTKDLDAAMNEYMTERRVPGGQLAVGRRGKILFSKGFGMADRDKKTTVTPQTLFRIASVSKPLTAAAVMTLIEDGKLSLETKMLDLLKVKPHPSAGDERLPQITVQHLLQHTGGWNRERSGDPMFQCRHIADRLDVPCPPGPDDIIREVLGRPLDDDPGAQYAYSNFGYCLLGRIIHAVSGQSYHDYVRDRVFKPAGVTTARLGATLRPGENEARCYMAAGSKEDVEGAPVFPGLPDKVPSPYGRWSLEAMDAHGGWTASAEDIVRFAMALDDTVMPCLFKKTSSLQLLTAPPPGRPGHDENDEPLAEYYACGFKAFRTSPGLNLTHSGSLPGTSTFLWKRADGLTWAAFFNQRWSEKNDKAIEPAINSVLDRAPDWK